MKEELKSSFKSAIGNNFGSLVKSGDEINSFLKSLRNDKGLIGITCTGKTDGGGAQVVAVMSALLYSHLTGIPYFHTPLSQIRFDDGQPDWAGRWERFFNLGDGEMPVPKDVKVLDASTYIHMGRPSNVIVRVPHCHNFVHRNGGADDYDLIRQSFRKKYYDGSEKIRIKNEYIAAHVRRGDVSATQHTGRYVGNDIIINRIKSFENISGLDLPLKVISQGSLEDFEFIKNIRGVELNLNVDVFTSINSMVQAKGLVIGPSSFSYIAALISEAQVMTEIWYHQPLGSWIVCGPEGKYLSYRDLQEDKKRIRVLSERLLSDPEGTVSEIDGIPGLLDRSHHAQWILARALLKIDIPRALRFLDDLATGKSRFAPAAARQISLRYHSMSEELKIRYAAYQPEAVSAQEEK